MKNFKKKKHLVVWLSVATLFVFFLSGCSAKKDVNLDPDLEDIENAIQLLMTGAEKRIYKNIRDLALKEAFMEEFWEKRDPDMNTEENEFREEFERRLAYANLHFKSEGIPGWRTDRGRIYIYLGPPDRTYIDSMLNYANIRASIVWVYYRWQAGVQFVDRTGNGTYTMNVQTHHTRRLMNAIDRAKFGLIYSEEAGSVAVGKVKIDYDPASRQILVEIPTDALYYKEEGEDLLVDLRFDFYVYTEKGEKIESFSEIQSYKEKEKTMMDMTVIIFSFPFELPPGNFFIDMKVSDSEGIGKFRKIEKIRIKG
jgi:GWxTD domain-containing protein